MMNYTVDGPLNIYSINDHHHQLIQQLDAEQDHELDLAHVNEIDATGVQWLVWLDREQQQHQHHLILRSPNQTVQTALLQCGCERLLASARYE